MSIKLSKSVKEKLVKGQYNVVCGEQVFTTKAKGLADKKECQWAQTHGKSQTFIFNGKEWVEA